MAIKKTKIIKDFNGKSILVSAEFSAPVEKVWSAYTESTNLGKWWAPLPWKAETKSMNFSIGGFWLYAMVSPENEKHWGRMNYTAIDEHKSFDIEDVFCNEDGIANSTLPASTGCIVFTKTANGTTVEFKMIYPNEKDMQTLVEMGFEQGITMCFEQLEDLFIQNKI
jgi:uncharacterized protein YndB with AHSA1/START domain